MTTGGTLGVSEAPVAQRLRCTQILVLDFCNEKPHKNSGDQNNGSTYSSGQFLSTISINRFDLLLIDTSHFEMYRWISHLGNDPTILLAVIQRQLSSQVSSECCLSGDLALQSRETK